MSPIHRAFPPALAAVALLASACGQDPQSPTTPDQTLSFATASALSFQQLSAGTYSTCGLNSGGLAYCWGEGDTRPVAVPGGRHFVQISTGESHVCAVTGDNRAFCWGGSEGASPVRVPGHNFRQIRAGFLHTCAVTPSNAAFCWGDNTFGQLGTGGTQTSTPTRVAGGLSWRQVVAGASHTCGVTTDNRGYCWGNNDFGQLGDGTSTRRNKPALIAGGHAFLQVVPGGGWFPDFVAEPFVDDGYTCGITTDHKAYCWGLNHSGVLGTGTTASSRTPVKVAGGRNWRFLNTGTTHACGVTLASAAFCWGSNSEGQLGVGSGTSNSLSPLRVAGGYSFSSVTVGVLGTHSCGWTGGGAGYCWGWNRDGQLGDGTTTRRFTPTAVVGP